ncbi:MAG: outer membrane protein assembly factor BamA [candidate division WOR-3 bacterium]
MLFPSHNRLTIFSFLILSSFFSSLAQSLSPIIIKITAQTEFVDSLLVIKLSGLESGLPYRPEDIREAIKRIYKSGRFSEIIAETIQTKEGVIVKFQTKDNPYLKAIEFSGNRRIKTKELKEKIGAKAGEVLSPNKIFTFEQNILTLYKEKGFLLTKVKTLKSEEDSLHRITIYFQIDEGKKMRLKKICFLGNKNLSAKALGKVMKNKEKRWYRKGWFREEEMKEDLLRIINLYKEKGFLEAKVIDYSWSEEGEFINLTIELNEGKKFYFGEIALEGEKVFAEGELRKKLRMKKGEVYNYQKINKGIQELYAFYTEEGYIYCQIVPIEEIREDTVDIQFRIEEGIPALIRLVKIEENKRTEEKVIRREITTLPGTFFKRSEVLRSQRNIFNLGFFEDVQLDYRKVSEEAGEVDLIYRVKEKQTFGTLGGGVSYSQRDGVTGYIEITQPNFLGKGEKVGLKLEKGGRKTNLSFSFQEPYLFDRPISFDIGINYLTQPYDYYDKQDRSIDLGGSYPLALDFLRGYFALRFGQTLIPPRSISSRYQPVGPYTIYPDTIRKNFIQPGFSFIRDSRDYIFNPSAGSYYRFSQTFSFGQIRFFRSVIEERNHFPLFWKFSLMFRSRLGLIGEIKKNEPIPLYEKFFPGGIGDDGVRGYPDRSLGPTANGYPIGGKALLVFNMEYKLKLASYLSFILFFDAGNAYHSFSQINLTNLKRGCGPGVRLEIPMVGLVGVDFGYGIDARPRKWEIHFQIGKVF